jgi:hypothetical protein
MLCSIELVKVKGGTVKISQLAPAVHWPDKGVVSKGCCVQLLACSCSTQTRHNGQTYGCISGLDFSRCEL